MIKAPVAPTATIVIFGALGDLTRRLLIPAIVNLVGAALVAPETTILGVSYHDIDNEKLRAKIDESIIRMHLAFSDVDAQLEQGLSASHTARDLPLDLHGYATAVSVDTGADRRERVSPQRCV